jgi:CBS domain-containing protein
MDESVVDTGPPEVPVSEIMSHRVVAIRSDCDLTVAVDTFLRTALRHLVVVDPDLACRGILSAEQAMAALDLSGRRPRLVRDHLPARQPRLHRDASVRRAAEAMVLELVDALPVVDDAGEVVGIVTWSDIVGLVATDRRPTDRHRGTATTRPGGPGR